MAWVLRLSQDGSCGPAADTAWHHICPGLAALLSVADQRLQFAANSIAPHSHFGKQDLKTL